MGILLETEYKQRYNKGIRLAGVGKFKIIIFELPILFMRTPENRHYKPKLCARMLLI